MTEGKGTGIFGFERYCPIALRRGCPTTPSHFPPRPHLQERLIKGSDFCHALSENIFSIVLTYTYEWVEYLFIYLRPIVFLFYVWSFICLAHVSIRLLIFVLFLRVHYITGKLAFSYAICKYSSQFYIVFWLCL